MSREDDDVKEKFAQRFDGDGDSSDSSVNVDRLVNVENVKDEWKALNVYLPEEMHGDVSDEFDRLKYVSDWDVKKGRHYYVALVALGLERVEEMDGTDLHTFIEELEL